MSNGNFYHHLYNIDSERDVKSVNLNYLLDIKQNKNRKIEFGGFQWFLFFVEIFNLIIFVKLFDNDRIT